MGWCGASEGMVILMHGMIFSSLFLQHLERRWMEQDPDEAVSLELWNLLPQFASDSFASFVEVRSPSREIVGMDDDLQRHGVEV